MFECAYAHSSIILPSLTSFIGKTLETGPCTLRSQVEGPWKPACDADGYFLPVQCTVDDVCWCVQANGQFIPNTFYQLGAPELDNCAGYRGGYWLMVRIHT